MVASRDKHRQYARQSFAAHVARGTMLCPAHRAPGLHVFPNASRVKSEMVFPFLFIFRRTPPLAMPPVQVGSAPRQLLDNSKSTSMQCGYPGKPCTTPAKFTMKPFQNIPYDDPVWDEGQQPFSPAYTNAGTMQSTTIIAQFGAQDCPDPANQIVSLKVAAFARKDPDKWYATFGVARIKRSDAPSNRAPWIKISDQDKMNWALKKMAEVNPADPKKGDTLSFSGMNLYKEYDGQSLQDTQYIVYVSCLTRSSVAPLFVGECWVKARVEWCVPDTLLP